MKKGWTYKKLEEVGVTQTGTTPSKQIKAYYGGNIPFIRPAELNIDENGGIQYDSELKLTEEGALKSRIIKANSVLMCCIGSVGKTGFTLNNVTCNQQINTLTPYDNYNPRFVYYALISPIFQQEVIKIANSAKATLPIISKGKWEVLSIPVPPLSEQRRIVSRLDSAFSQIDELKANAEKQLGEAKALFQKALAEEMKPKEGWEEKTFGEVCSYHKEQGIFKDTRYLGMEHMESGTGRILGYGSSNEVLSCTFKFNKGEVLYGRLRPYLQKVYVAEFDGCCSTEVFPIKSDKVESDFIKYWLLSDEITNKINATSAGCRMPRGNMNEVKKFDFFYPKEKADQQAIVTRLDALSSQVRQLEENCRKTLAECDALKQAMLREVFE